MKRFLLLLVLLSQSVLADLDQAIAYAEAGDVKKGQMELLNISQRAMDGDPQSMCEFGEMYAKEGALEDIINKPEEVKEDYQWQSFKEVINYNISGGGDKKDKVAYCNLNHLEYVFSKLDNISDTYKIPIYMCSGNHEYKDHTYTRPKIESQPIESPPIERPTNPHEYGEHTLLDIQKKLFKCDKCKFIEKGIFVEGGITFFVIKKQAF